jgi:hypothetical protein
MHGISIKGFAQEGIALVENGELRCELNSAYNSEAGRFANAQAMRVFDLLCSKSWPAGTLCRFLNGWQTTHVTALYVSGLMIRLLREAEAGETPEKQVLLYSAAREIGEIIAEDTGVDDTPHNELYLDFAEGILGDDDRWKLRKFSQPQCEDFRRYVKQSRLEADLETAILLTAASENWNTGEYSFFDTLVMDWMTGVLELPEDRAESYAAYVTVHAGKTELGHFLHALSAWQMYCQTKGISADPQRAKSILQEYLKRVGEAFAELEQVFQNEIQGDI